MFDGFNDVDNMFVNAVSLISNWWGRALAFLNRILGAQPLAITQVIPTEFTPTSATSAGPSPSPTAASFIADNGVLAPYNLAPNNSSFYSDILGPYVFGIWGLLGAVGTFALVVSAFWFLSVKGKVTDRDMEIAKAKMTQEFLDKVKSAKGTEEAAKIVQDELASIIGEDVNVEPSGNEDVREEISEEEKKKLRERQEAKDFVKKWVFDLFTTENAEKFLRTTGHKTSHSKANEALASILFRVDLGDYYLKNVRNMQEEDSEAIIDEILREVTPKEKELTDSNNIEKFSELSWKKEWEVISYIFGLQPKMGFISKEEVRAILKSYMKDRWGLKSLMDAEKKKIMDLVKELLERDDYPEKKKEEVFASTLCRALFDDRKSFDYLKAEGAIAQEEWPIRNPEELEEKFQEQFDWLRGVRKLMFNEAPGNSNHLQQVNQEEGSSADSDASTEEFTFTRRIEN